jgi:hypothetical protein
MVRKRERERQDARCRRSGAAAMLAKPVADRILDAQRDEIRLLSGYAAPRVDADILPTSTRAAIDGVAW